MTCLCRSNTRYLGEQQLYLGGFIPLKKWSHDVSWVIGIDPGKLDPHLGLFVQSCVFVMEMMRNWVCDMVYIYIITI